MAVNFQDVWVVPNPELVGPFRYLLEDRVRSLDKFTPLVNGYNGGLLLFLTEEVGLTEGLANAVKSHMGTAQHTEMNAYTRVDVMVLYFSITRVLRKKMPLEIEIPPVIGKSKTTLSNKEAKMIYDQAKAFLVYLQGKTRYLL